MASLILYFFFDGVPQLNLYFLVRNLGIYDIFCPGKLRDVEVMCQENEAEGGEIIRKVFTQFAKMVC